MKGSTILEAIRVANKGVAEAETDLARLLNNIETAPRAEKTTISEAIRQAFQKLRDAREHLGKLETLIRDEDD